MFLKGILGKQSQGSLERLHQTLKTMIRSYCFDTENDWNEGIHLLLFAVRESVQECHGFSPFELVFRHTMGGPLKLLKEKIISDYGSSLILLQYVSDFKNRLSKIVSEYDQEIQQSQTADNPMAPRGRAPQPLRDSRKTN